LDRLFARLVESGRILPRILGRTGGPISVGGLRDRLVHETVLFAGDAAGLTHPISGAGIAAAVLSGEMAGRAAAAYLAGKGEGVLKEYEEDIRDLFAGVLDRALNRRRELYSCWRGPDARRDEPMRRGWIAFEEYYAA
jgi:digeranylgeranylglycerophospholipid reductase